jgi:hypothetical protein
MSEPSKKEQGGDPSTIISPQKDSSTNKGEAEASMSKELAVDEKEKESQEQDDSTKDQKPKDAKKKGRWQKWKEAKAAEAAKAKEDAEKEGEEAGPKDGIFKNFFVGKQAIGDFA